MATPGSAPRLDLTLTIQVADAPVEEAVNEDADELLAENNHVWFNTGDKA